MFEVKIEYKYQDSINFHFADVLTATEFMRIALPADELKIDRFDSGELVKPVITLTEIVVQQVEVKENEEGEQ